MSLNEQGLDKSVTSEDIVKFVIASAIGGFLFLIPIPSGSSFTIPLGIVINFISDALVVNGFHIAFLLVLMFITVSALASVLAYTVKPAFIMNNETLKKLFMVPMLYFISKIVGLIVIWMVYFKVGPQPIISGATGGSMLDVSATLVSTVLAIAFTMPLLTDFGIMEFIGVLIRKVVRLLFTCPGRSSIDLMTSWFGAPSAAVILTKGQYESGYYTGREAAVISTNFSLVSIPFCFVIASLIGIESHFTIWYIIICITGMLIAMITPRIWPLSKISDTYDEVAGKQISEAVPEGVSLFTWAVNLAGSKAQKTSFHHVIKSGLSCYLTLFMDLIPLVVAWGTVALILVEYTPVFQWISYPMGLFMSLFGIEGAMELAPTTLVGFVDMYIPALMLADVAFEKTKFILGALSLVQIIYMTEVGILIVKSRIPMNVWQLFVVFMERTLIAIPVLTLLTNLLVRF